jgi:hypothetical protein
MWYGMIQEQIIVDKKNTLANYFFFHQFRQMIVVDKNGTIFNISKVRFSSGNKDDTLLFQSNQ